MLIDLRTNKVYVILVYAKRQGFAPRYKKEPYFLDITNKIPTVCNKN